MLNPGKHLISSLASLKLRLKNGLETQLSNTSFLDAHQLEEVLLKSMQDSSSPAAKEAAKEQAHILTAALGSGHGSYVHVYGPVVLLHLSSLLERYMAMPRGATALSNLDRTMLENSKWVAATDIPNVPGIVNVGKDLIDAILGDSRGIHIHTTLFLSRAHMHMHIHIHTRIIIINSEFLPVI